MEREPLGPMPADLTALIDDGYRLWRAGDLAGAWARLEAARERARREESLAALLSASHLLGGLAYARADLPAAREHHLFVLAESERLGLGVGVASSLHNLGLISAHDGDLAEARYQLLAAADRYERLGMPEAAAAVRANLTRLEAAPPPAGDARPG